MSRIKRLTGRVLEIATLPIQNRLGQKEKHLLSPEETSQPSRPGWPVLRRHVPPEYLTDGSRPADAPEAATWVATPPAC